MARIVLPYFKTLQHIRRELEKHVAGFPDDCCHLTAKLLQEIPELEVKGGKYVGKNFTAEHSWNYDPRNNRYVCITMDQFPSHDQNITILHTETKRLRETPKHTQTMTDHTIESILSGHQGGHRHPSTDHYLLLRQQLRKRFRT